MGSTDGLAALMGQHCSGRDFVSVTNDGASKVLQMNENAQDTELSTERSAERASMSMR